VVQLLKPVPGKRLVDATLGGGGHAEALLAGGAEVIGVDRDPSAVTAALALLSGAQRFRALEGRAGELETLLGPMGLLPVDGVLLDLGVSSPQLDTPARGFSFQADGPWTCGWGARARPGRADRPAVQAELGAVLRDLGEPFAKPIARALKRNCRPPPRARWSR
jgi:16S rRNA (cytosine1402-N4)-methyltransferase